MPLSEHEQRLLEQMERAFYEDDPQFASSMERPRRSLGRRTGLAIVAAVVGLATILVGLSAQKPVIGVVGFAFLIVAGSIFLTPKPAGGSRQPKSAKRSLADRMNNRWESRRNPSD
jgi:hypothetical protein